MGNIYLIKNSHVLQGYWLYWNRSSQFLEKRENKRMYLRNLIFYELWTKNIVFLFYLNYWRKNIWWVDKILSLIVRIFSVIFLILRGENGVVSTCSDSIFRISCILMGWGTKFRTTKNSNKINSKIRNQWVFKCRKINLTNVK